jgi:hypothetical protein
MLEMNNSLVGRRFFLAARRVARISAQSGNTADAVFWGSLSARPIVSRARQAAYFVRGSFMNHSFSTISRYNKSGISACGCRE